MYIPLEQHGAIRHIPGPTHGGCHFVLQGAPVSFSLSAASFYFSEGLFTSCLVKELARIGPWKENRSFGFLFHTFPGVSTELWVFGPTSWEFQDMNRKPWEGPGIR